MSLALNQNFDHLFKLLVIGNSCAGKSSMLVRFSDGVFSESFLPTIGVDFKIRTFDVNNRTIKLQIWDTAGQERYKNITANYYKGAHGIIVVYDITDNKSFDDVQGWLDGIWNSLHYTEIAKNADEDVVRMLVGNKSDLEAKRKVRSETGAEFAKEKQMTFMETSAKTANNIDKVFFLMAEIIKNKLKKEGSNKQNLQTQSTKIMSDPRKPDTNKTCC